MCVLWIAFYGLIGGASLLLVVAFWIAQDPLLRFKWALISLGFFLCFLMIPA